jgi:hypothetical protein
MDISATNPGQRRHNTEAEEGGSKGKGPKNSGIINPLILTALLPVCIVSLTSQ